MSLEDLKIYNLSMKLGEDVWGIVNAWDYFQKDTVGKQLIRSVDSIAANISECYGRFHFKNVKNFGYYSRGSLYETKTWLSKAHDRQMISQAQLNSYIKSIGHVNEPAEEYSITQPND